MASAEVIYFGEENSRHFRYLCMKSEYDKMFYQHQSLMNGKPTQEMLTLSKANLEAAASVSQNLTQKPSHSLKQQPGKVIRNQSKMPISAKKDHNESLMNSSAYRSICKAQQPVLAAQKSSSEQSLVVKSSDVGVQEVLDNIQRYCNQVKDMNGQMSAELPSLEDILIPKKNSNGGLCQPAAMSSRTLAGSQKNKKVDDTEIETPNDSTDETYTEVDDFQLSSDISTGSEDDDCGLKYPSGATTSRPNRKLNRRGANQGAGDGQ